MLWIKRQSQCKPTIISGGRCEDANASKLLPSSLSPEVECKTPRIGKLCRSCVIPRNCQLCWNFQPNEMSGSSFYPMPCPSCYLGEVRDWLAIILYNGKKKNTSSWRQREFLDSTLSLLLLFLPIPISLPRTRQHCRQLSLGNMTAGKDEKYNCCQFYFCCH